MAYRKVEALYTGGYKTDGSRGEDGDLAFKLYSLGRIKLLTSRDAVIYTSMRRVEADGSLFKAFKEDVGLLPPRHQLQAKTDAPRAISDYIAGMTDRYAMKEYRQIFLVDPL